MLYYYRDNIDNDGLGMIKNVFSHLMDISWQDYDLNLLRELQLPDYLFESIIGKLYITCQSHDCHMTLNM